MAEDSMSHQALRIDRRRGVLEDELLPFLDDALKRLTGKRGPKSWTWRRAGETARVPGDCPDEEDVRRRFEVKARGGARVEKQETEHYRATPGGQGRVGATVRYLLTTDAGAAVAVTCHYWTSRDVELEVTAPAEELEAIVSSFRSRFPPG